MRTPIEEVLLHRLQEMKPRFKLEVQRVNGPFGRLAVVCEVCGVVPVDVPPFAGPFEAADLVESALEKHLHPAPQPLSAAERELARVKILHRRGAYRLAACPDWKGAR